MGDNISSDTRKKKEVDEIGNQFGWWHEISQPIDSFW